MPSTAVRDNGALRMWPAPCGCTSPRAENRTKREKLRRIRGFPSGGQGRPLLRDGVSLHSAQHYHPRRRVQSKALCAADGTENLLLGSQIVITPSNRYNLKQRTRVLTKTVGTLVLYCTSSLEPLGYQKGRGPFVEAARAAQPLLSNFFLAARHHSSLRS